MSLDKKTIKKIESEKGSMVSFLRHIEEYKRQLEIEKEEKKIKKLQSKMEQAKRIVLGCCKKIEELGGDAVSIINELPKDKIEIMKDILPYGFNTESIESQKERNSIINQYKRWINKLEKLRKEYPPYNPDLPIEEKLKNKIYKQEKDIGWFMLIRSNPEQKAYDPEWNYKEHFATATEFTQEERDIIEHCIKVGEEYDKYIDKYLDERFGFLAEIGESLCGKGESIIEWGNEKQAKIWAKNLHTKVFPQIVRSMEEGENLTEEEVKAKSIEMTKGFIRFIADREELNRCLYLWNELKKDETLDERDEDKKDFMVFLVLRKEIGEEKAWYTYGYTRIPKTEEGIELLLNYSLGELGLE